MVEEEEDEVEREREEEGEEVAGPLESNWQRHNDGGWCFVTIYSFFGCLL